MGIKIEKASKVLSANGGLAIFRELLDRSLSVEGIKDILPKLKQNNNNNFNKFRELILGFIAGADCLDDMDKLCQDDGFAAVNDDCCHTSKSHGDFLRSFELMNCKNLNLALIDSAFSQRRPINRDQKSITMDFDSTSNEQCGKKMEGVSLNYKGLHCLDTIQAFDELGFQYWNDVRAGNTYTSNGVTEIIHSIFNRMPKDGCYAKLRRYARGDSGFCNADFFNACLAKDAGFVTSMRQNMLEPLIKNIRHWRSTNLGKKERIKFYDDRECEIGETLYKIDRCPHILRVVVIRALKPKSINLLFKQEEDYDYRGWVTSIGEHEMSSEKLIKFYRKRGQSENFIRELKYGFDLKHYPCQKLVANKAYGIIAAFAYNLMRLISLKKNPEKPQYAKAIRFHFVNIPVQIVRHARDVIFRFEDKYFKEVKHWLETIKNLQLVLVT